MTSHRLVAALAVLGALHWTAGQSFAQG